MPASVRRADSRHSRQMETDSRSSSVAVTSKRMRTIIPCWYSAPLTRHILPSLGHLQFFHRRRIARESQIQIGQPTTTRSIFLAHVLKSLHNFIRFVVLPEN